jgi:RimJ/RimL family protein N-acetyltransferase
MPGAARVTPGSVRAVLVTLRAVEDADLPVFHAHQADPEASAVAVYPSKSWDDFVAHWARIRPEPGNLLRTVLVDGEVAGNVVSWPADGQRLVGYWIGREFWGRGVATRALAAFVDEVTERPLAAYVALSNAGSVRVLERCGFTRTGESTGADGVAEAQFVLGGGKSLRSVLRPLA